jgi:hypothetical protein
MSKDIKAKISQAEQLLIEILHELRSRDARRKINIALDYVRESKEDIEQTFEIGK